VTENGLIWVQSIQVPNLPKCKIWFFLKYGAFICGVFLNSCMKHRARPCEVQQRSALSNCDVLMKVRMENTVVLLVLICEHCFWFIILVKW